MRSWPAPEIPALPALDLAPELALFDARVGQVVATNPGHEARLYVCGITPYDATHMGHAATYVAFDLAIRTWLAAGHRVRYVQNVTDIDDPLLERAKATGQNWVALAEKETQLFREDMTALSVIPPDVYAGAVESIPLVVALILELQRRDAVYDVDGDLYFSVHDDPDFGSISGLDKQAMHELFAERGGDPDRPGKRDPLDCLLWMRQRPGEPGWETEVGTGRPGWHIECAAIAVEYLGTGFDVQGGGSDLAFPHHEMSAAECQVAYPNARFAKAYVHAGMVGYDGHKMSKSRGNLVLVSRLRDAGVDPRAIRLSLLSQHYRSDWEWTESTLVEAEKRLASWTDAVRRGGVDPASALQEVRNAMADDLDAPRALAAVDAWAAEPGSHPGTGQTVADVLKASLGVDLDLYDSSDLRLR